VFSARKPARDIALISDCISAYEPGKHLKYDGREILVKAEGGCYLAGPPGQPPTTLAGSTVTLADQLYSLTNFLRIDLVSACRMLATTPATIAGIDDRVGSIAVGKKANLLCVDLEHCTVEKVMVHGRWVNAPPYRMLRPSQSHI
jgi:N-acetylglucosamine-6-phosphate deacetylase